MNFDLALSTALSELGAGKIVGVIERPEDLTSQKTLNVFYLHRNANAADPEHWVLRKAALDVEWKGHWEGIIAARVLTAPIVLFAGLGTPVAVLIESTKLLKAALPVATKLYLAGPGESASCRFFQELNLDPSHYIRLGWGALMAALSARLLHEQMTRLAKEAEHKIAEEHLPTEDITPLIAGLQSMGFVNAGKLRAQWLLYDRPYRVFEDALLGLLADLILALATISRVSGARAVIGPTGGIRVRGSILRKTKGEIGMAERVGLYPTQFVVGTRWDAFFRYRNLLHPKDLF